MSGERISREAADPGGGAAATGLDAELARIVRDGDQDRYWSALLAPDARRRDLLSLYAFNIEIARIPQSVSEPQLGMVRLKWWHDVLSGALAGEAADPPALDRDEVGLGQAEIRTAIDSLGSEPAPGGEPLHALAHPALAGMVRSAAVHGLPARELLRLVEAREAELTDEGFAGFEDLEGYCDATTGAIFRLGARILGAREDLGELARWGAVAYGLAGVVRGLPRDAARGNVLLPHSLLANHGLHPDAIRAGVDNADLRAAIRDVCARAEQALKRFRSLAGGLDRSLRPAFLPVVLVDPYLRALTRADHHPLRQQVQLNPLRRYFLLWRAYLTGGF